ncbi:MAG: type II secretion system protein [Phycisphaerae bacterium]|nr:type II secretion system protein [Phycisphaerae bacterium]
MAQVRNTTLRSGASLRSTSPQYYSAKRRFAATLLCVAASQSKEHESAIQKAFTLIELMVVIAIIILVAATALPTLTGLFTSGSDAQAYNTLSAQLDVARALALLHGDYAAVHVQMADPNSDFAGKCYSAVFRNKHNAAGENFFVLAEGYEPRPLPGSMAFGNITGTFVDSDGTYKSMSETDLDKFTSFTIIFNAQGEVVRYVPDGWIFYGPSLFKYGGGNFSDTQLWGNPWLGEDPEDPTDAVHFPGATCVTIIDYKVLLAKVKAGGSAEEDYLDEYGQFLALNLYTGKFFHRY